MATTTDDPPTMNNGGNRRATMSAQTVIPSRRPRGPRGGCVGVPRGSSPRRFFAFCCCAGAMMIMSLLVRNLRQIHEDAALLWLLSRRELQGFAQAKPATTTGGSLSADTKAPDSNSKPGAGGDSLSASSATNENLARARDSAAKKLPPILLGNGSAGDLGDFWLTRRDVPSMMDFYAASWCMGVDHFARVDTSERGIPQYEGAVFSAIRGREGLLRKSLDYLDWSVEHLSTWWRVAGVPANDAGYGFAVRTLSDYVERHARKQQPFYQLGDPHDGDPEHLLPLRRTVAVIAFSQVRSEKGTIPSQRRWQDRDRNITVLSLAATAASLVQAGVGRIVVVGSDPTDEGVVNEAFRLLVAEDDVGAETSTSGIVTRVRETRLAVVSVPKRLVKSARRPNNVPRAALAGLQIAFNGTDQEWTRRWLGGSDDDQGPGNFRYVYYTEADSILQTRPSTLPRVKAALDMGLVVVPHRLVLIPYEGDMPDFSLHESNYRLVTVPFKTPILLNSGDVHTNATRTTKDEGGAEASPRPVYQHCCDAQEGDYKPGPAGLKPPTLWWQRGWKTGRRGDHWRLQPYDFIRLSHGTGITTLAGTNQGCRCVPSTSPCVRLSQSDAIEARRRRESAQKELWKQGSEPRQS